MASPSPINNAGGYMGAALPNTSTSPDYAGQEAAQRYAAQQAAGASEYGSGLQYQLGQSQLAQKGSQFNDVYGLLSGQLGNLTSQQGGAGGVNTAQPTISANPTYTPLQIQQAQNQAGASAMQGAAASNQALASKMAGEGFGARSPALQQQQSNAMMQALSQGQTAAQNIGMTTAQQNAQQVLAGQTAQEQQWQDYNQAQIGRAGVNANMYGSLAGALAGII
jgi:hypothetical protein